MVALASLVARSRSAVERDRYTRDILLIPDAEAPTRLLVELAKLFAGLITVGTSNTEAWRIIRKVRMDCLPATRRLVLTHLAPTKDKMDTKTIAIALGYPTNTTRRACEDLAAQPWSARRRQSAPMSLSPFARHVPVRLFFHMKSAGSLILVREIPKQKGILILTPLDRKVLIDGAESLSEKTDRHALPHFQSRAVAKAGLAGSLPGTGHPQRVVNPGMSLGNQTLECERY